MFADFVVHSRHTKVLFHPVPLQDKRVKTALRRLLHDRLFGSTDKKKSRREDDVTDTWTNADSLGNNVSATSSAVGTRSAPQQGLRLSTVSVCVWGGGGGGG